MTMMKTRAKKGVASLKVKLGKSRNTVDWITPPPALPNLPPITSTAALPLDFISSSSGIYDISLVESNNDYLVALDSTFWTRPVYTANARGPVPRNTAMNPRLSSNTMKPKNPTPVTKIMIGVRSAATDHVTLLKMLLPINMKNIAQKPW